MPEARGLYDPDRESDSCGVGAIVDLRGRSTHRTVADALTALRNLG
ncbi:glutamate synthase, partial [Rhodococcus rhodochrous]